MSSLDYVILIVLTHHECYDGRSYSYCIAGGNIPVGGRMIFLI
nr:hypothetical protein [uncultured Thomasclavelia sp.]